MKTFFVYILECSDNSYYTGITSNLDRRLQEHKLGIKKESYTYNRRPFKLVYSAEFSDPNDAIAIEKRIKGWSRKKKEALINDDFVKLVFLSNYKKGSNKPSED